jgi:hypothetical protein
MAIAMGFDFDSDTDSETDRDTEGCALYWRGQVSGPAEGAEAP